MEFWGLELPGKEAKPIKFTENSYLHLTQAALGTAPKDGERVVLQIGFGDQKFVLGTLVKSTCDQIHLDLVVDKDFTLEHNGSSSIFVAGYMTAHDFEMGREEDSEEEEEEEEEESEDDEEHEGDEEEEEAVVNATTGNGVPEKKGAKQAGKLSKAEKVAAKRAAALAMLDKAEAEEQKRRKGQPAEESEDEEEGESDEDEDEEGLVLRGANTFEGMESDDDLEDDSDEFADGLADEDDDSEDIEEGDFDSEEEESDDMDEDEEAVENAQPPPKSAKRPAAAEAKTPGSQKKAKVEAATPKTPAAAPSAKKTPGKEKTPAPAKTPKTPAAPGTLGKYQCEPCSKSFTTETALNQHNSAKHK